MKTEYTLKDMLKGAAAAEYAAVSTEKYWDPSDKHREFMSQLFKKQNKAEKSGILKKIIAVAAAVVLIFGLALLIKPVREPVFAALGSLFGNSEQPGTETDAPTPVTESVVTEEITAKQNTETEEITDTQTEYTPKTAEDWIDVLVEAIAAGDNSSLRWETLHSFGETAFDHLVTRYFNGEKDAKVKSVISVFISEIVKDEVVSCESLTVASYPERAELNKVMDVYSPWLTYFRSSARTYMGHTVKEDALQQTPLTCRFLSLVGYDSYRFDPGRESVEACINRLITVFTTEVWNNLTKERKNETIEYCTKAYFKESDQTRRVYMSWLTFCAIGRWEMQDLVGYDLVSTFYKFDNGTYLSEDSGDFRYHPDIVEPIIRLYAEAAVEKAMTLYRQEIQDYCPGTYVFLSVLGFDEYKPEPYDIAYRTRPLLEELNVLYKAVTYGLGDYDETSEYYSAIESSYDGINRNRYPDGLKEKIRKLWYKEAPTMVTQKQGLKTIDEWYEHYSTFLPEDIVYGFIKESYCFIINDGIVYTLDEGEVGDWTTTIQPRTAHIVEEKDGYTVIGFDVYKGGHMVYETTEFTVNVATENGSLRIIGGTFLDRYLKNDTKAVAADALHTVLLYNAWYYNGNTDVDIGWTVIKCESPDDIPGYLDYLREYYDSDIFPSYLFDEYTIHWEDHFDNDTISEMKKNHKAIYKLKNSAGIEWATFLIPSLVTVKNVPAFCAETELSVYNILQNMKTVSQNERKTVISLDFIREENKESKNVTYTFEFEYTDQNNYIKLTGGTFLTKVLLSK